MRGGLVKEVPVAMDEDPMDTLCRFVIATKYEDLPAPIVDFAKMHILNTLGCVIGGSKLEGVDVIVEFIKELGGKEQSILPLYGGKYPSQSVAFALGPMTRAIDMGDVNEVGGHSAEYVFPALLAAIGLKDKVSGKEFITAFVLGEEVILRMGLAQKMLPKAMPSGSQCGHYIFGAVAVVGKLLGFNYEELRGALGMASCMTQPHDKTMYYNPATLMVRVHHGFIAQDAINCCLLSKEGITAPYAPLLGKGGYFHLFVFWEDTDLDKLTQGLGRDWFCTKTCFKPYPGCKGTHYAIYAIEFLMKEHKIAPEDIAHIHIELSQLNLDDLCSPPKWEVATTPDAQFSIPYQVATMACTGTVFIDSFTEEARARKDVRDLMTRITTEVNPEYASLEQSVTITVKDGTEYSRHPKYVKGNPEDPFTWEDTIEMFKKMKPYSVYELSDSLVNSIIDTAHHLEDVDDVETSLIVPLTPP